MRRISEMLAVIFLIQCVAWETVRAGVNQAAKGLFQDDFGLSRLDTTKWNAANGRSEVDGELQVYSADNIQLEKGNLLLVAKRESSGSANYTSALVDTRGILEFLYGEVEIVAKMPKGKGVRASIALLPEKCTSAVACPENLPPAVTLLNYRGDQVSASQGMVVFENNAGNGTLFSATTYHGAADLSADFHNYKLRWTRERLTWWLDGTEFLAVNESAKIPRAALHIVMRVAVGGGFAGAPDGNVTFPTGYVRGLGHRPPDGPGGADGRRGFRGRVFVKGRSHTRPVADSVFPCYIVYVGSCIVVTCVPVINCDIPSLFLLYHADFLNSPFLMNFCRPCVGYSLHCEANNQDKCYFLPTFSEEEMSNKTPA
ncbi:beta-glucanase-like [Paramacrobiotus metropolitanus]|uniref:beta-glucanase-like n=1 Tax=Paramacrobiotus metropolitanus TaxID=2943436 RepID=UPI002445F8FD|nr:beta-glucanase-like [Paramacrobiotus metropolitanus]